MSVVSPCHLRDAVLRASYLVYFEMAFSSVRAWSIWSYAYVAMAAVVIVSPLRVLFVGLADAVGNAAFREEEWLTSP